AGRTFGQRRGLERRDARLDLVRYAEVQRGDIERPGDLFSDNRVECTAVDASDDLAQDEAVGERVVAGLGAGLPQRGEVSERATRAFPVAGLGRAYLVRHLGNARGVAEDLPKGDRRLAVPAEFGPIASDRRVVVEPAALGEQMDHGGGDTLGAGEDAIEGVTADG